MRDLKKEAEILSNARMTKAEVERSIKAQNYVIYEETEKEAYIQNYVGGCGDAEEAEQEWEKLEKVKYNGDMYRVEYIL